MDARSDRWRLACCVLLLSGCGLGASVVGGPTDAGVSDLGADVSADAGSLDAGSLDAGSLDAGSLDAGSLDAPPTDAPDVGPARCQRSEECRDNEFGFNVCDLPTGRCVACSPTADTCPAGQFCDGATFRCSPGCRNDEGCAASVVGDGGVSPADGGAPTLRCELPARRCVECVTDAHCPAGLVCSGNRCVAGCNASQPCPSGLACCDSACVNPQDNTAHCGGCGMTCAVANGAPRCSMGACAVGSCTGSFGDCDVSAANGCETDTATTAAHCGACGRACARPPNATARCTEGACAYDCNEGFADCDGMAVNGCEVDTRVTPSSCGMCGNACPARANATPTCAAGACGFTCNAGFANCNGLAADGCEVNLAVDAGHCGSCGTACPAGATCAAGTCSCPLGTSSCAGACVNLTSDSRNCGACGAVCAAGQVCRNGTCQATCASGSTLCGTQCVTLGDNPLHCGACNNRCPADSTCASGVCVPVVTVDPIGCADGTREAFSDRARFPRIAGCSGAWSLPGIFPAIPASSLPACATLGNSSTSAPANGAGCASSNLCARGWRICNGGEVTPRTGASGCAAEAAYPASSFFAAAVSGTGCGVCALRSGTLTGSTCTSLSCTANCRESGDLNNDFFGCGTLGAAVGGACDGLNRFSNNDCGALGAPWSCGGSTQESRTVVKTSSAAGGVLCCRD